MSMIDWAKNEVRLASRRELLDKDGEDDGWDYGCACYESALKAFKSLEEDGHSGMSISITKQILIRLIDGKPLTPIEDVPEVWNEITETSKRCTYQCKRYSGLFKNVYKDGSITYNDLNRIICKDLRNGVSYLSKSVDLLIDTYIPDIEFPYTPPTDPYIVTTTNNKSKHCPSNSDFDMLIIHQIIYPNKKTVLTPRLYFIETADGWRKISKKKYMSEVISYDQN
jgi:hypothetical protein